MRYQQPDPVRYAIANIATGPREDVGSMFAAATKVSLFRLMTAHGDCPAEPATDCAVCAELTLLDELVETVEVRIGAPLGGGARIPRQFREGPRHPI